MLRVFVAGASGAIGARLVPQLLDRGHEVIGTSRSPGRAERLRALGAEPIVLDLLDAPAVGKAIVETKPDAIVHQATALASLDDFKHFNRSFAQTNRLRTQGTDALLAAAQAARVGCFVAQSFASRRYARQGGPVKTEQDPFDPTPVPAMRQTEAAMEYLDQVVTGAGGIALRLRQPLRRLRRRTRRGRAHPKVPDRRRRRWRLVVHPPRGRRRRDRARARPQRPPGIYNIVDDEPAPTGEWLPALARIVGAKPPLRFPRLLARLFAGEAPVVMGTESRGASNAKAKRELGWTLRYPSWRQGFVDAYT